LACGKLFADLERRISLLFYLVDVTQKVSFNDISDITSI